MNSQKAVENWEINRNNFFYWSNVLFLINFSEIESRLCLWFEYNFWDFRVIKMKINWLVE
jgi:hypothetical protein